MPKDNKRFDPKKFIDRQFEQELFEELLKIDGDARVLAIRDKGGMGKTQLLEKFQYRCRTVQPRTPVCFVSLDQLPDPSPLTLVKTMEQELRAFGLDFPEFKKYEIARVSGDFGPIQSSMYLQGADFRGARDVRVASGMTNVGYAERVTVTGTGADKLTPEQQAIAHDVCVQSFLSDLGEHCSKRTVALLIDAFEKCEDNLKEWIETYLLERYFFDVDHRPKRLVLVLAGREIPEFEYYWAVEVVDKVVKSVKRLGQWEKKHVEECLRAHGFSYEAEHLELFWDMVKAGMPPSVVVEGMQSVLGRKE